MTGAPKCKLCGKAHWSYESHAGVTKVVTKRSLVDEIEEAVESASGIFKAVDAAAEDLAVAMGRPRRYKDNAARQKAYRTRKAGSHG